MALDSALGNDDDHISSVDATTTNMTINESRHNNNVPQHILHPLSELRRNSYKSLLQLIPPSTQIVLIGEGTHGTEEFVRIRSEVTQCLLLQGNGGYTIHHDDDGGGSIDYHAIVCEGDVQPFFKLNEFVTMATIPKTTTAAAALLRENGNTTDNPPTLNNTGIRTMLSQLLSHRFPDWMWSNVPMAEFVYWLQSFNNKNDNSITASNGNEIMQMQTPNVELPSSMQSNTITNQPPSKNNKSSSLPPVQLLGMDIQSPFTSMECIIQELTAMGQEELSTLANTCYAPLYQFRSSHIRKYGDAVYGNKVPSQESNVKCVLDALLEKFDDGVAFRELAQTRFEILEHAHAIVASEAYHRQRIYPGHAATWNLRTRAFMDSILRTMDHIRQWKNKVSISKNCEFNVEEGNNLPVRLIVWAHNSHVGDMRSTGYSSLGQVSLGQLCRETFGEDGVFVIGMTTHEGEVRAAYADRQGSCWHGCGEVRTLTKSLDDSHEYALHVAASDVGCVRGELAFGMETKRQSEKGTDSKNSGNDCTVSCFDCSRNERFVGSCYLPQTEMMSHYAMCNLAGQFDYIFHVDVSSALTI